MSCFSSLFARKNTSDNAPTDGYRPYRPSPRYASHTKSSSSSSLSASGKPRSGLSRPGAARPRLYHTQTRFVSSSGPVRPDSPMPRWGEQGPRRTARTGNPYPPRTAETRKVAPRRQQQQQQRAAKPTAAVPPPAVRTTRPRVDALGISSGSGSAAQATGPVRERRREDRRQQQQQQQQSGRGRARSPTSSMWVQPPTSPKGKGKAVAKNTPNVSRPGGNGSSDGSSGRGKARSPTSSMWVQAPTSPKGKGKAVAKDTRWDSACDLSRPSGSGSSGSGVADSSRGQNTDGVGYYADPPVSLPLRQHSLLDEDEDDEYIEAAAAALGRQLHRYPSTADGKRRLVRESFFAASEQLRARAERQQQRQQQQEQKQQQQRQQEKQRRRRADEENRAAAAAAAAASSSREPESARYDANMEAAAVALDRILESTKDSLAPVVAGGGSGSARPAVQAAAVALDRILESTKDSLAPVVAGGGSGGARPTVQASPATNNGQLVRVRAQQHQQRSESGSSSGSSSSGEYVPRHTADRNVTREMQLLMAHVNQEMEDHEREVRARGRAKGGSRR